MIKIAFYKAKYGDWLDKLISVLTLSKYSHCEIILEDGTFVSSSTRDNGVRFRNIPISDHWDYFDVTDKNGFDLPNHTKETIRYWFQIFDEDPYDWHGAIGTLFHLDLTDPDKKFCSYCCAIVLGLDPIVTPGGLYKLLIKENMIRV